MAPKKDPHNDTSKPNIRALKAFRLKGRAIPVGLTIPKAAFAKTGDWQNLCHMTPAKAEETSLSQGLNPIEADEVEEVVDPEAVAEAEAAQKAAEAAALEAAQKATSTAKKKATGTAKKKAGGLPTAGGK